MVADPHQAQERTSGVPAVTTGQGTAPPPGLGLAERHHARDQVADAGLPASTRGVSPSIAGCAGPGCRDVTGNDNPDVRPSVPSPDRQQVIRADTATMTDTPGSRPRGRPSKSVPKINTTRSRCGVRSSPPSGSRIRPSACGRPIDASHDPFDEHRIVHLCRGLPLPGARHQERVPVRRLAGQPNKSRETTRRGVSAPRTRSSQASSPERNSCTRSGEAEGGEAARVPTRQARTSDGRHPARDTAQAHPPRHDGTSTRPRPSVIRRGRTAAGQQRLAAAPDDGGGDSVWIS